MEKLVSLVEVSILYVIREMHQPGNFSYLLINSYILSFRCGRATDFLRAGWLGQREGFAAADYFNRAASKSWNSLNRFIVPV